MKEQGTIQWIKGNEGYGFITVKDGKDVLLHINLCKALDFAPVHGMCVEFEAVDGDKGRKAVWVGEIGK